MQTRTNDGAVAEEELMELRGEAGEQASERGDQAAHDGRQSCGFAAAERYRHRRQQQRHSRGHCSQPSCGTKKRTHIIIVRYNNNINNNNMISTRFAYF